MLIEQTFIVNASRDEAANFFADVGRVAACIPGVEGLTEVSAGRYGAVLGVRLGPIRAAFHGEVELDLSAAPARFVVNGQGRDRSTGSTAKIHFTADLTEVDAARTQVATVADLALRGRMAQFGTGVTRAAAGEMVKQFATCANASLAADPGDRAADPGDRAADPGDRREPGTASGPPDRVRTATSATPGLLRIVARGIRVSMVARFTRWCGRLAARVGRRR